MKLICLHLNFDFYVTCLCLDNILLLYEDNKCCFVFDMCNLWREYYSHLAEEEYQLDKFNNVFKIMSTILIKTFKIHHFLKIPLFQWP